MGGVDGAVRRGGGLERLWRRRGRITGTGSCTSSIHPFYYIEYGIAQLGALQVWANSKRDQAGALRDYKSALTLGGSRPLPELFAAAGCRFDFSRETIAPLVKLVREELAGLERA